MKHRDKSVELIKKVKSFCKTEGLIKNGDRIVVGISGGADSVCMLRVLCEMQKEIEISLYLIHIHHGIRGQEADRDAEMVRKLAERLSLPFRLVKKNVPKIAGEGGMTEEEAGRKVRYEAFESYRKELGADKIAVAHHEDDQAETVLFHLFRGTGPKGLSGMAPMRGHIIRPLLCVSRNEIENFAQECGLDYITDETNRIPDYTRNKMRLELIPYVKREINVRAVNHIAGAARKIGKWSLYMEEKGREAYARLVHRENGYSYLSLHAYKREEEVIRDEVVRLLFEEYIPGAKDIGEVHYAAIDNLAYGETGKRIRPADDLEVLKEYRFLRFGPPKRIESEKVFHRCGIPSTYMVEKENEKWIFSFYLKKKEDLPLQIPQKDYTKWFDYDMIKGSLTLRNPEPGDYFVLNEKGEKKKLGRYYSDRKIPEEKRAEQLVLAENNHVLWALPERISFAYRVTELTKNVLVVTKERERL